MTATSTSGVEKGELPAIDETDCGLPILGTRDLGCPAGGRGVDASDLVFAPRPLVSARSAGRAWLPAGVLDVLAVFPPNSGLEPPSPFVGHSFEKMKDTSKDVVSP